jgi:hypothetical protein
MRKMAQELYQVEFGKDSGGMSPRLIAHLPGWLLVSLGAVSSLNAERRFTRQITRRDGGG